MVGGGGRSGGGGGGMSVTVAVVVVVVVLMVCVISVRSSSLPLSPWLFRLFVTFNPTLLSFLYLAPLLRSLASPLSVLSL